MQRPIRSSNSVTAYLDSAGVSKQEPACTRDHCSVSDCCWRMNPNPCLLASVHSLVSLSKLKYARVGASVSYSRALLNACSCSSDHKKSFFVLRSGRNGSNNGAIVSVQDDSWLTRPKNDRRSEQLDGAGK